MVDRRETDRQQAAAIEQQRIDADVAAAKERFITSVEKAAGRNDAHGRPIPPAAFPAIIKVYNEEFDKFRADIERASLNPPNLAWRKVDMDMARKDMFQRMHSRLSSIKGGNEAMIAAGQEAQGDGLFTPIIKNVYDTDKGGPQWGGIAGVLLGGFVLHHFSAALGPLINGIVTVVGGLLLGYAAHKFIDKPDIPLQTPDFHEKSFVKAPGKERGIVKTWPFNEMAAQNSYQHHDNEAVFPPTTPNNRSNNLQK